ncbi:hypothetical protein I203_102210 [Kwoniella mangroviensis CBS 8507]|uniref:uncharacterized protein n=1 Tax=Kwoniella mangroviensis CBS 8507 TaxID=1296122 RepID=UPI00080D72D9|nr:uncharacterized protein I203_03407 [Kwoniella mangroviensis CBS 8507]OCF67709.1 hypothetical protein I203_03407 [Kwoniella mangroviensis CBS 8507]
MSDRPLSLPIIPSSPSLHSHLAALDHLSLQLQHLTTFTTRPARIPLGTKASMLGDILHTNDIKVNIGCGYWVDMTAQEASEYVKRRKDQLLEEHARLLEGHRRPAAVDRLEKKVSDVKSKGKEGKRRLVDPKVGFHPVFHKMPETDVAGSSNSSAEDEEGKAINGEEAPQAQAKQIEIQTLSSESSKTDLTNTSTQNLHSSRTDSTTQSVRIKDSEQSVGSSLLELLDDKDGSVGAVGVSGNSLGDSTTTNEEGLPIHEIRETLSGETIGPPPPPSTSSTAPEQPIEEIEDDYFSPEAVARRAALRRRLFNEDTSSEEDEPPVQAAIKAKGGIIRSSNTVTETSSGTAQATPPSPSSPPVRERRPSCSQPLPSKSILKPSNPPTLKKSVTFDPSLPSPPTSPASDESLSQMSKRFGFPLPLAVSDESTSNSGEFSVKPVPVIPPPRPRKRDDTSGFAGFKRGFLDGSSRTITKPLQAEYDTDKMKDLLDLMENTARNAITPAVTENATSSSALTSSDGDKAFNDPPPQSKMKKQSLFSQRLSQPEIDASAPNIQTTSTTRIPNLPKVSESKGTNTIKPGVIEKPPVVQHGVKERLDNLKIVERPISNGIKAPMKSEIDVSVGRTNYTTIGKNKHTNQSKVLAKDNNEEEEEDDEDDDDDEFSEYSTGEEDEYDLDQALLAREVALEYHKRQTYKPLNRDLDDPHFNELQEGEGEGGEGGGGVMLGLPRISEFGEPMIINPKPEDLRRFIRVGKLENGNLVLAPGEESLETDEEDQDEENREDGEGRKERRENRENIKKKLMGLEIPTSQLIEQERTDRERKNVDKGKKKQYEDWEKSLPPILSSDNSNTKSNDNKQEVVEDDKDKSKSKPPIIPLVPESPIISPDQSVSTPTTTPGTATSEGVKPKKVSRFKASRMANN